MKSHINLLPRQFRQRLLFRTRIIQWSLAWTLSLIAGTGVLSVKYFQLDAMRHMLAAKQRESSPIQTIGAENQQIRNRLAELKARQKLLLDAERTRQPLQLVGLISRSARKTGGRLKVENFTLVPIPKAVGTGTEAKSDKPSTESYRLTLKGTALDFLAVTHFVVALRDTDVFRQVKLKSSTDTHNSRGSAREYRVECVVERPVE